LAGASAPFTGKRVAPISLPFAVGNALLQLLPIPVVVGAQFLLKLSEISRCRLIFCEIKPLVRGDGHRRVDRGLAASLTGDGQDEAEIASA